MFLIDCFGIKQSIFVYNCGFLEKCYVIIKFIFIIGGYFMKRYVTKIKGSDHNIYKIAFGTYDILKSGLSEEEIKELLTDFVSMGGNVIDTSRFDIGPRKSEVEECQKLVGKWVKESGKRKMACIIAKTNYLLKDKNERAQALKEDIEISLKNLNTDYIDVFLINGDDKEVSIAEIIEDMENLKSQGKILNYGCSNWTSSRIREAMEYCREKSLAGFVVNQMLWNIGSKYMHPFREKCDYIKMDDEMMEIHQDYDIVAMPYSSLANGFFSKLYLHETEPGSVNIEKLMSTSPYYSKMNLELYNKMKQIGERYIAATGWVALGYLFNQQINTCSIIGCKNLNQLKEAFEAVDRAYTYEDFIDLYVSQEEVVLV